MKKMMNYLLALLVMAGFVACSDDNPGMAPVIGGDGNVTLELKRDSTFGVYQGIVYDEQDGVPVQDAVVTVDNRTTRTDVRGIFKIVFPLQEQTLSKSVRIEKEGYLPRLRVDECPDAKNLTPYPMRKNT